MKATQRHRHCQCTPGCFAVPCRAELATSRMLQAEGEECKAQARARGRGLAITAVSAPAVRRAVDAPPREAGGKSVEPRGTAGLKLAAISDTPRPLAHRTPPRTSTEAAARDQRLGTTLRHNDAAGACRQRHSASHRPSVAIWRARPIHRHALRMRKREAPGTLPPAPSMAAKLRAGSVAWRPAATDAMACELASSSREPVSPSLAAARRPCSGQRRLAAHPSGGRGASARQQMRRQRVEPVAQGAVAHQRLQGGPGHHDG